MFNLRLKSFLENIKVDCCTHLKFLLSQLAPPALHKQRTSKKQSKYVISHFLISPSSNGLSKATSIYFANYTWHNAVLQPHSRSDTAGLLPSCSWCTYRKEHGSRQPAHISPSLYTYDCRLVSTLTSSSSDQRSRLTLPQAHPLTADLLPTCLANEHLKQR